MHRSAIFIFWLAWLAALLVCKPVVAQSPSVGLPTSSTQDSKQLPRLVDCISELGTLTNDFDDAVDALFHKKLDFEVFCTRHEQADILMGKTQDTLIDIEKQFTGSLNKLVRPQVRDCIEALRSYRGATQALVKGKSKPSGFKYSQYARATSYLLQCVSNCLQTVQQVRAEQQIKEHVTENASKVSKESRLRIDSLKRLVVVLHRGDSVRFATLTDIGRRVEAILRPYSFPRYMILAGVYQTNAYSLGSLHYNTEDKWVATGGIRYHATAKRISAEAGFGYLVQSFGLMAGPTLQIDPVKLGWKIQACLLKTGLTLGAAYDSRLGPGVLAGFGIK